MDELQNSFMYLRVFIVCKNKQIISFPVYQDSRHTITNIYKCVDSLGWLLHSNCEFVWINTKLYPMYSVHTPYYTPLLLYVCECYLCKHWYFRWSSHACAELIYPTPRRVNITIRVSSYKSVSPLLMNRINLALDSLHFDLTLIVCSGLNVYLMQFTPRRPMTPDP